LKPASPIVSPLAPNSKGVLRRVAAHADDIARLGRVVGERRPGTDE
jgi:hypothetical protein